jgi:hypothetical protein
MWSILAQCDVQGFISLAGNRGLKSPVLSYVWADGEPTVPFLHSPSYAIGCSWVSAPTSVR